MELAPDLGLGDSSLHRYLDGEFWSLKNELRELLGSCPLFRHRYRAEPRLPLLRGSGSRPSVPAGIAPQPPARTRAVVWDAS
jgi:hypothetical protein